MLVEPVGGAVNLLLVLAAAHCRGGTCSSRMRDRAPRRDRAAWPGPPAPLFSRDAGPKSAKSPYLRLIAALVFLSADRHAVDRHFSSASSRTAGSAATPIS